MAEKKHRAAHRSGAAGVRTLYIVQQSSGHAWHDLHPFWKNKKDAIIHMNECKQQLGTPFRVIKRTDEPVA